MNATLSTAPPITAPAAMVVLGVTLGLASLWLLWRARRNPTPAPAWLRLPGLPAPSKVTYLVAGLAGLIVAYHLFVYGAGFDQFRFPLPLAVGVGALAVIASLAVDALENKMLNKHSPDDHRDPPASATP
ncbi:MAG TPA: hypothetical protein VG797_10740 [Phycisphaerales bacterium]|nr:hypothetical protein [Phycisphaerales bacterium]